MTVEEAVVGAGVGVVEQEVCAAILFNDDSGFGFNLYGVESVRLGTGVFDATIDNGGQVAKVNYVNAAEHEDEFEAVEVALLGRRGNRCREQVA